MTRITYVEFNYAECHYAECHYAECHGTVLAYFFRASMTETKMFYNFSDQV